MNRTTIVNMTPKEVATDGFLKVKEWDQPVTFRFLPDPDFRGKLKSVTWNTQNGIEHLLTEEDEAFALFQQVGERPEITVSSDWIESLGLKDTVLLRIRFEFETFRMEPVWYAYLFLKQPYGDSQENAEVAYKISSTKYENSESKD